MVIKWELDPLLPFLLRQPPVEPHCYHRHPLKNRVWRVVVSLGSSMWQGQLRGPPAGAEAAELGCRRMAVSPQI